MRGIMQVQLASLHDRVLLVDTPRSKTAGSRDCDQEAVEMQIGLRCREIACAGNSRTISRMCGNYLQVKLAIEA